MLKPTLQSFEEFKPVTINQTSYFELDMPPAKALPLFTGPGEEVWIDIWKPVYLHGDGFSKGTIFVTQNHNSTTYWQVLEYDVNSRKAVYSRVTPDSDTGFVEVNVQSNKTGGSKIIVSYQLTSLSEDGSNKLKDHFNDNSYKLMMHQWKDMIEASKDKIDQSYKAGILAIN